MEKFKFLQPLDQMARVSRAELGSRLDEILDIVDRNNVGYVITDEGKNDLVLCPARWINCIYRSEVESVVVEFKINVDLYNEVGVIFKQYGLTHEEAILLFIKETVRRGRIPFEYTQEDLAEAIKLSSEVDVDD